MSNAGAVLAVGVVSLAGGALLYKAFAPAEKKDSAGSGGGGTSTNEADACEASLDKLPEPFHSMLLSPATDLGDPDVVKSIADQLDKANLHQQANCLRKFLPAITAEHGVSGEDVSDNCSALIDADSRFSPIEKNAIKDALKTGSKEQLMGLAKVTIPVNAKLGHCMEAVAKTRASGGVGLDKKMIDILNGVSGKGAEPMTEEFSKISAGLVG